MIIEKLEFISGCGLTGCINCKNVITVTESSKEEDK